MIYVTALFTTIPVNEDIQILTNKARFNRAYYLQLDKEDLVELREVPVKNQLCQFDGNYTSKLMESPWGPPRPLLANTFMCNCVFIRRKTPSGRQNPQFLQALRRRHLSDYAEHHRSVDVLNWKHPALTSTMELVSNNKLLFLGMNIIKSRTKLETSVYKKLTNTGHSSSF